jgi:hypothetical protein
VHRLADDELAQHRPECRAAIAPPGIRRLPGALELHVHPRAIGRDLLAEQDGAAIAEAREVPELMPGIRLRERPGAVGQGVAGEDRRAGRRVEGRDVEPEGYGQRD